MIRPARRMLVEVPLADLSFFLLAFVHFNPAYAAFAEDLMLRLRYDRPADNWQLEALPIGNGWIGEMVSSGVDHERIHFDEDSLWSQTASSIVSEKHMLYLRGSFSGSSSEPSPILTEVKRDKRKPQPGQRQGNQP